MASTFTHPNGGTWKIEAKSMRAKLITIEARGEFSLDHAEEFARELLETVKLNRHYSESAF